ncbi:MAG: putative ester cyclase [Gemmatimonadetes bacterium]|nr:putative ester cyclase [Gemmatimonadota bacterium]
MSETQQTLDVMRAVFAGFHAHDLAAVRGLLADDVAMPDPNTGAALHGPDALIAAVSVMLDAFPDLHVSVTNAFADGERGVVEVMRTGTHTGPLRLPSGEVPATGRKLHLGEAVVFVVRGGKVVSFTPYTDQLAGMMQLELLGGG